jgi:hypothetical protein
MTRPNVNVWMEEDVLYVWMEEDVLCPVMLTRGKVTLIV